VALCPKRLYQVSSQKARCAGHQKSLHDGAFRSLSAARQQAWFGLVPTSARAMRSALRCATFGDWQGHCAVAMSRCLHLRPNLSVEHGLALGFAIKSVRPSRSRGWR